MNRRLVELAMEVTKLGKLKNPGYKGTNWVGNKALARNYREKARQKEVDKMSDRKIKKHAGGNSSKVFKKIRKSKRKALENETTVRKN